jgi:hypothetical protein
MREPKVGDRIIVICGEGGLIDHVGKAFSIIELSPRSGSIIIDYDWFVRKQQWVFETELIKALI